ncbi:MAG: hypothetical protein R3C26_18700 [Calditrichia bacterium]
MYFNGQMVVTNVPLNTNLTQLQPLGDDADSSTSGKLPKARSANRYNLPGWTDNATIRWLQQIRRKCIILGRTGANDPDFNLRSEQVVMLRGNATDQRIRQRISSAWLFQRSRRNFPRCPFPHRIGIGNQAQRYRQRHRNCRKIRTPLASDGE